MYVLVTTRRDAPHANVRMWPLDFRKRKKEFGAFPIEIHESHFPTAPAPVVVVAPHELQLCRVTRLKGYKVAPAQPQQHCSTVTEWNGAERTERQITESNDGV